MSKVFYDRCPAWYDGSRVTPDVSILYDGVEGIDCDEAQVRVLGGVWSLQGAG